MTKKTPEAPERVRTLVCPVCRCPLIMTAGDTYSCMAINCLHKWSSEEPDYEVLEVAPMPIDFHPCACTGPGYPEMSVCRCAMRPVESIGTHWVLSPIDLGPQRPLTREESTVFEKCLADVRQALTLASMLGMPARDYTPPEPEETKPEIPFHKVKPKGHLP